MTTQKEIVKLLDRAANRSSVPATSKQTWFLAGLIARGGNPEGDYQDWLLNTSQALSKDLASSLIETYLACEKRAA